MSQKYFILKEPALSLMEVMIALVIVAIIGGIAYPSYQKMVTRAKQTEAKTMLRAIYSAQNLYKTSHQKYASKIEDLDIQLPADAKYLYSLTVDNSNKTFKATGLANIDSDSVVDEWNIDHNNQLVNTVNDVLE